MRLSMNGEVEVLFDFAFVVYVGSDPERIEGLIAGKPVMKKGVPVMVKKFDAQKLLRYEFYVPWVPTPSDIELVIDTDVVKYDVTAETLIIPADEPFINAEYNEPEEQVIVEPEPVIAKQTRVRRKEVKPRKPRTKRNAV